MSEQFRRPFNLSQHDPELPRYAASGVVALTVQSGLALPKGAIILIDDSEDDAELSLRGLHKLDLHVPVVWLNDSLAAIEAIERLQRNEDLPRLILLDLHMPRVDGFEILRRLRAHKPTANLPVIVMVGSAKAPELPRCFSLGANAHVVKPLHGQPFLAACERAVVSWPAF